jgi:hypothetical protein
MRPQRATPGPAGQFLDGPVEVPGASARSGSWRGRGGIRRGQCAGRDRRPQGRPGAVRLGPGDSRTVDLSGHCAPTSIFASAFLHDRGLIPDNGRRCLSRPFRGRGTLRGSHPSAERRPNLVPEAAGQRLRQHLTRVSWPIISLWFFVTRQLVHVRIEVRPFWKPHRNLDVFLQSRDHIIVLSDSRARVRSWDDYVP